MSMHPNNPQRHWVPWQRRVKFRLAALEAIPEPTQRQLDLITQLRHRLYKNLQWFKSTRQITTKRTAQQ